MPAGLDVSGQVGHVAAVLAPIVIVGVLQFAQQDGPSPFREKQQGETGADRGMSLLVAVAGPEAGQAVLLSHQVFGALAIPIGAVRLVRAIGKGQKSPCSQSADPLQTVEIIEQIRSAAGIVRDGIMPPEPSHGPLDAIRFVRPSREAAFDPIADDPSVGGSRSTGGDDHRGDAGAGHASPAGSVRGAIAPRTVGVLATGPVFLAARHVSSAAGTPTRSASYNASKANCVLELSPPASISP